MVIVTSALFGFFFLLFSYLMIVARDWRQVMALILAGVLVVILVSPPSAHAQASLVGVIETVLNTINGVLQTALNAINSVRSTINQYYQEAIWPVSLINQAKTLVSQMIGQYRSLMQSIFNINLSGATLARPTALESVLRNHQTGDFGALTTSFGTTFGAIPPTTAASPADRTMMDMDDALAMDNLKTLKESDSADDLALQAANSIEDQASQAAPGIRPVPYGNGRHCQHRESGAHAEDARRRIAAGSGSNRASEHLT